MNFLLTVPIYSQRKSYEILKLDHPREYVWIFFQNLSTISLRKQSGELRAKR